ncbi:ATP-binding protein [Pseudoalteromonas sp. T1lg65]|uniref:hybrid sensor histidine kinase/response regulator n=1 Tax=Pseudoalteromonas sp. T1lg65 TaxID=2077101 RepID=UPI003F78DF8A
MQTNLKNNIKGFVPLLFMSLLLAGVLGAAAAYFLPKSVTLPTISTPDLKQQANLASEPLAMIMLQQGYGQAKRIVNSLDIGNENLAVFLYANSGMGNNTLIYQTQGTQPLPALVREEQYNKSGHLVYHTPLAVDGQIVGELILSYTPHEEIASTSGNEVLSYTLFASVVVLSLLLSLFIRRKTCASVTDECANLESELLSIAKDSNFNARVTTNHIPGVDALANAVNKLLKNVQAALESDLAIHKELKQLQESLETEVQARTLALEKATLNAERASEAKTTFLATMSHEIRTPMNGVIGTIDLLRQTDLDGAQHRLTTIIRDSAFSLLGILDDILDFSKIEAGKLRIDNSQFSVTETTEEVARVLSSVAKKRKLDLQLCIAPDIPTNLVGDAVRVRQVLYNLCSNAIKFTTTDESHQGYVRISVEVAQNTSEHFTLRFTVTDNGKGMTQAQLREIFNPFIQAEGSITREYGGTGLGLSICKSLVELMLGTINVTSDIGMGSEFVVELPFSVNGKIQYAHKGELNHHKVAVLTPNAARRTTLSRYLSFIGAQIVHVEDKKEIADIQHEDGLIWVLDGLDGMEEVNEELRTVIYSLEKNSQQAVVLSKMDEAALNHSSIFYLNAAPLCKSSFIISILVAAGLHKPKELRPTHTLNDFLSIDDAREKNRLVLLVEDNILNQQVLTDQLHLLGYGVEVAENGEEGLALWQQSHSPIILTDLHMPKMSGYDMVKKIRELAEQADYPHQQPYIIAVTANALQGERERCEAAGMNDYITKPVELNVLEQTLKKYFGEQQSPEAQQDDSADFIDSTHTDTADAADESAPLSLESPETAPINLEMLNKYVNNDTAKRTRFFRMYLEQSSQLTRDINGAVISMSQEEIVAACHQLKSISKTIGAEKVAECAEAFEAHCKEEKLNSDQLIKYRDELEQRYLEAAEYIQRVL